MLLTYSENYIKFYLNGRLYESYKISDDIINNMMGINKSSKKVFIGKDTFGNFNGSIDELKLYNTAINNTQVRDLYKESGLSLDGKIELNLGRSYMTVNGSQVEIDPGREPHN